MQQNETQIYLSCQQKNTFADLFAGVPPDPFDTLLPTVLLRFLALFDWHNRKDMNIDTRTKEFSQNNSAWANLIFFCK